VGVSVFEAFPQIFLPGHVSARAASLDAVATALQEQLGLRLEASRAPVEVLVIDRVAMPAEN
jgi:uncharacterized protein (TIGR03435 family)